MWEFIHRENIKHFRSLLEATTDKDERQIILELLAEEEAKEAAAACPLGAVAAASSLYSLLK